MLCSMVEETSYRTGVSRLRVAILGAGSMGMLWAATLARGGASVYLLPRSTKQAKAIQLEGLQLVEGEQVTRWEIKTFSKEDRPVPVDAILLTVKQFDLPSTFKTVRLWASAAPPIIALQNGWGHEELLLREFPHLPLGLAVTTEGARREGDTRVHSTGKGLTWIGLASHSNESTKTCPVWLDALLERLKTGGFQAKYTEYIQGFMWKKLIINSVINPLTGLWEIPNGELPENEERLARMKQLFHEAIQLSRAEDFEVEAEELWESILTVCRQTALNRSSMLQDLDAGRPTEIDSINGAMVRLAHQHGMKLPFHERIMELIHRKEARGKG
jgi:2-dehydropantoate 2-reductase